MLVVAANLGTMALSIAGAAGVVAGMLWLLFRKRKPEPKFPSLNLDRR